MITLDDFKTNRDTQITVGCIAFFLIAFPLYFSFAASGVSSMAGARGVGDYQINGNLTYVQLTDGIEYIADGDTYMIDDLHTDSIDGAEDMNIVGVRVLMSYGEDEEGQGGQEGRQRKARAQAPAFCLLALLQQQARQGES